MSSTVDVTQPVLVVFRSSGSGMMRLWANGKQVSPNAAGGMGAMVVSSVGRAADLVLTGRGDAHDLALGVYRLAD